MSYTNGLDKPSDYFNTKLYTGTGSTNAVTGVGFQPDWVWIKNRSITANHHLFDVIRGATKYLLTNVANAEATDAQQLQSFDSDGFTVGTNGNVNGSGNNIVAWNWLASNTTASNTDGSITSTVSANTTSGFSVGTYSGNSTTGATVGHGLGSAPSMVIVKKTNNVGDWYCYHSGIGATAFIKLNETGASATNTLWNDTAPTSSVFSMDSNSAVNGSGDSYVFYAFAEKKGFSKFGSYTGNGSTDGTFVYTGMKPSFVIVKQTNTARTWVTLDNKRANSYNPQGSALFPNTSEAETTGYDCDFLSNGFKIRNSGNSLNNSGGTFIYMCFAENPFVTSTSIPTTAR